MGCFILITQSEEDAEIIKEYLNKVSMKFRHKIKNILAEPLLVLVNKGNEI